MSGSSHINFSFPGPVVLEKKIFKWPHPIFAFLWLSPLWRKVGPSFEQTWIPFTQGCFQSSLVEIGQRFWRRSRKCEKLTDGRTDRQMDDGRQVIRIAHLSFQLRWAKNCSGSYKQNKQTNKVMVSNKRSYQKEYTMKYESLTTYQSKVMTKVKSFLK